MLTQKLIIFFLITLPVMTSGQTAQEWFDLAYQSVTTDRNYELGIAQCSRAIELDPNFAEAWNRRGFAYFSLRNYPQAISDLSQAVKLDPSLAKAYYNRGMAYYYSGDYSSPIGDFQKVIQLNINLANVTLYENLGYCCYRSGRFAECIAAYDKSILLEPADANSWLIRGLSKTNLGQNDGALTDYSEAIRLDPSKEVHFEYRANLYLSLTKYREALADYEQMLQINPKSYNANSRIADAYFKSGDYHSAIYRASEALLIRSDESWVWNLRGISKVMKGSDTEALADFNEAIRLDPKAAYVLNNRGYAYYKLGQNAQAIADYDQAIAIGGSNYAPYWTYRSEAASKLNLSQLSGSNVSAQAVYDGGMTLIKEKKFDEALAVIDNALGRFPNEARLHFARYMAMHKGLRFVGTTAYLEKAIALDPNRPEYHYYLGWEYFLDKKDQQAKQEFEKSMALGGNYLIAENSHLLGNGNYKQVIVNRENGGPAGNQTPATASTGGAMTPTEFAHKYKEYTQRNKVVYNANVFAGSSDYTRPNVSFAECPRNGYLIYIYLFISNKYSLTSSNITQRICDGTAADYGSFSEVINEDGVKVYLAKVRAEGVSASCSCKLYITAQANSQFSTDMPMLVFYGE